MAPHATPIGVFQCEIDPLPVYFSPFVGLAENERRQNEDVRNGCANNTLEQPEVLSRADNKLVMSEGCFDGAGADGSVFEARGRIVVRIVSFIAAIRLSLAPS